MLATLRQRDFALLWFGALISYTGNWAMFAALPFFVYEQTDSAFASGAILTAIFLPLLFSSVAGVFVDRWDRKKTLVVSNLAMAVVELPLLLAGSDGFLWVAYASVSLVSSAGLFAFAAENALLPRLVGRDRLLTANSLNSLNDNLARIAGPAIGGALVAYVGLAGVVIVDVLSFAVAAGLISLIRTDAAPETVPESVVEEQGDRSARPLLAVWFEWLEGLRLVMGTRTISILFLVAATAMLADSILSALLAPFVGDTLGAGASIFGLLLTLRGVGGILGGVVAGYSSRWLHPERLLAVCLIPIGIVLFVMVVVPLVSVSMVGAVVLGILAVGWLASQQTLIQTGVADRYLGRAFGAFNTTNSATLLLGTLLAGALADFVGIVPLLCSSAVLYSAAGVIALILLSRPGGKVPNR